MSCHTICTLLFCRLLVLNVHFVVFERLFNHLFYLYIAMIKMYKIISNVNGTVNLYYLTFRLL